MGQWLVAIVVGIVAGLLVRPFERWLRKSASPGLAGIGAIIAAYLVTIAPLWVGVRFLDVPDPCGWSGLATGVVFGVVFALRQRS